MGKSEKKLKPKHDVGQGWTPESNPALKELLDHLAQELAAEYVRLMKPTQQTKED